MRGPAAADWKGRGLGEKAHMPTPRNCGRTSFSARAVHHKERNHQAAEGTFNAWLLLFDPEWSLPLEPGKKNEGAKLTGKPRAEARLHLAENLLALGRAGDARAVVEDLSVMIAALPADAPDKAMAGDAAWLRVSTFAPPPQVQQQLQMQQRGYNNLNNSQQADQSLLPPGARGEAGPSGPIGSPFEQFAMQSLPCPGEHLWARHGLLRSTGISEVMRPKRAPGPRSGGADRGTEGKDRNRARGRVSSRRRI